MIGKIWQRVTNTTFQNQTSNNRLKRVVAHWKAKTTSHGLQISVRDVPSEGGSHRVFGHKTQSEHIIYFQIHN